MAGVVLETLSGKKLTGLGIFLLLVLIAFFLLGGLIAPSPSNVVQVLATKCISHNDKREWYIPRDLGKEKLACDSVMTFDDPRIYNEQIVDNDIVFSFLFPHPREGEQLKFSRWQQSLIGVMHTDIEYNKHNEQEEHPVMVLDLKLGYRNVEDKQGDWKLLAESKEERTLDCSIDEHMKHDGFYYNCSLLPLFELGALSHHYYLLNLRIKSNRMTGINMNLGKIADLTTVAIHQNGGFTKVWISLKTVMFPTVIIMLIWFWRRIRMLSREPNLLERTLFCLGMTLSLLNLPVEWLTLAVDMPFMLMLTDIRQGLFYAMLMCFWLIFSGEHIMDQVERNKLTVYWKHLSAVGFGSICLFVFEICERGVQLTNPFYNIWVTEAGRVMGLIFIVLAGIAACMYFIFLCYMIFRVFRNISTRKSALPHMSSARRKFYQGLIYRFKFLMLITLVCAALTVIFFIVSQVSEGKWKWGDEGIQLEYTSAFFTGVYGMWNVYVIGLLSLYAPSHKTMVTVIDEDDSREEEVQLTQIPTDTSNISSFVSKAAAD